MSMGFHTAALHLKGPVRIYTPRAGTHAPMLPSFPLKNSWESLVWMR
jgi:hypothetical protein